MKLNETNASFAVVATAFHGGGTWTYHNSLDQAMKSCKQHTNPRCVCGCCAVIPITEQARNQMIEYINIACSNAGMGRNYASDYEIPLYSELSDNLEGAHPSDLIR